MEIGRKFGNFEEFKTTPKKKKARSLTEFSIPRGSLDISRNIPRYKKSSGYGIRYPIIIAVIGILTHRTVSVRIGFLGVYSTVSVRKGISWCVQYCVSKDRDLLVCTVLFSKDRDLLVCTVLCQ